ncbi:357_t:CDS:1, partial [Funneliformis geosporum]
KSIDIDEIKEVDNNNKEYSEENDYKNKWTVQNNNKDDDQELSSIDE